LYANIVALLDDGFMRSIFDDAAYDAP